MSPFKSLSQMKYLYAKEPLIASRWRKENPKQNLKALPMHAKKKKMKE